MKILIADDELVSRMKLKKILEPLGHCELAANGEEALAAFKTSWQEHEPFDLICLDVSMPGKDGMDVLFEIRELELEWQLSREKPVRVIMITSHKDKGTVYTAVQAGCDGYIIKPFNADRVKDEIRKLGFRIR